MIAVVQSTEGEEEVQSHIQDECDLEKVHFLDRHIELFLQQGKAIEALRCSSWDSSWLVA